MKKKIPIIIEGRVKELLTLVKEGTQVSLIERELALLVIDMILALKNETGSLKFGCKCFRRVDLAVTGSLRKKLSEAARELLSEMVILDEVGSKYGPDLNVIVSLAKRITEKQNLRFISDARKFASAGISVGV